MSNLLLHPQTERQLMAFHARPSHALLLTGPAGSGKRSLVQQVAETELSLAAGSLASYPYYRLISLTGTSKIGIEAIRDLEHFLCLKVPRPGLFNRVVIFDQAELLSEEAQNALLKTLEEPPRGSLLLLTASYAQALLPTIRSRLQQIAVLAPAKEQIAAYYKEQGAKPAAIEQAYRISGGLPGLMHALLTDQEHPLSAATETARQLLRQTQFERLVQADALAKQKDTSERVVFILQQMAHVGLQTAQGAAAVKWQKVLKASYDASKALSQNGQPKLVLTRLMLEL